MRLLAPALLLATLTSFAQQPAGNAAPPSSLLQQSPSTPSATLSIPALTQVLLAMVRPEWSRTAKPGDAIYAQVAFPVSIANRMAIPPGTYVQGLIDSITRPGLLSPHSQLQIHFTELIFDNGYTVEIANAANVSGGQSSSPAESATSATDDIIPAVATPYVDVSPRSDVLLDNGTQLTMVVQLPLVLDATQVADAVAQTKPALLAKFKSATQCRPIPATPGTSDTVIPGTPGSPGTPDTVIPGAPGQPDIVIPGTPPTPGTPDTIIPGTAGTPEIPCPAPPMVTTAPQKQNQTQVFQVDAPMRVGAKELVAGNYEIAWAGMGPAVQASIRQNKTIVANAPARIVWLNRKSPANLSTTRINADGSRALDSLRFSGANFALYFE
jgi:hypothetical protein